MSTENVDARTFKMVRAAYTQSAATECSESLQSMFFCNEMTMTSITSLRQPHAAVQPRAQTTPKHLDLPTKARAHVRTGTNSNRN